MRELAEDTDKLDLFLDKLGVSGITCLSHVFLFVSSKEELTELSKIHEYITPQLDFITPGTYGHTIEISGDIPLAAKKLDEIYQGETTAFTQQKQGIVSFRNCIRKGERKYARLHLGTIKIGRASCRERV